MQDEILVQQGWQCPICKRVYSPITPMCYYCGQGSNTSTTTDVDKVYSMLYTPISELLKQYDYVNERGRQ